MLPLDRITREFKVSFTGLKRTLTGIAVLADENMQVMKLTFRISEIEKKMDRTFRDLGGICYLTDDGPGIQERLSADPEVAVHVARLQEYRQESLQLEKEIEGIRSNLISEELAELTQGLRKKGGMIRDLTLPPASPWTGKKVAEVPLPPGVLIMALFRGEEILYPEGDTPLREGDRVYLIGPENGVFAAEGEARPPQAPPPLSKSPGSPRG